VPDSENIDSLCDGLKALQAPFRLPAEWRDPV